jgi:microcystin-dependent protein
MSENFLGQVSLFGFNFAPLGWALCQGQILSIGQSTALFSLLGTTYGGNGTSNFALPDLRGRVPNNQGEGPGLSPYDIGEIEGVETVTLTQSQMPTHNHNLFAIPANATTASPSGALLAQAHDPGRGALAINRYAVLPSPTTNLSPNELGAFPGGNGPHNNLQPFLTLNWCIALQGIFPSRN